MSILIWYYQRSLFCRWVVLFSHPADFTPVCTTELGRLAVHQPHFVKRNTKLLAHSVDKLKDHVDWVNVSTLLFQNFKNALNCGISNHCVKCLRITILDLYSYDYYANYLNCWLIGFITGHQVILQGHSGFFPVSHHRRSCPQTGRAARYDRREEQGWSEDRWDCSFSVHHQSGSSSATLHAVSDFYWTQRRVSRLVVASSV